MKGSPILLRALGINPSVESGISHHMIVPSHLNQELDFVLSTIQDSLVKKRQALFIDDGVNAAANLIQIPFDLLVLRDLKRTPDVSPVEVVLHCLNCSLERHILFSNRLSGLVGERFHFGFKSQFAHMFHIEVNLDIMLYLGSRCFFNIQLNIFRGALLRHT